eukprot:jgi/Botrbrau1/13977/Bobra.117_2s0007.1
MDPDDVGIISSGSPQADGLAKGPSPPFHMIIFTRLLELITFVLIAIWVFSYLGGLSLHPKISMKGNDTGGIFNWHPLLMTLAFPVLMTEALLAYRAPIISLDRWQQKLLHAGFHSVSLLSVFFGVVAAWRSHTLKQPAPIPNLYSVHSYAGLLTLTLFLFQYVMGFCAFLYPKFHPSKRAELVPLHRFLGASTYWTGLTTMLMGIQEKGAFVQLSAKLNGAGLYKGIMKVPALAALFIICTGLVTLYQVWIPGYPDTSSANLALLSQGEGEEDV